ncbi:hypothetical protein C5167_014369 [Papaver somniferum]|uniref:Splicing factor subunit n=1 Tax=Papaver somniferum TaxID=3469 RepID=A0A4Y7J641_PAPSO|nr:hypothetical protein C5167_014369 [Papaver somniferum]
MQVVAEYCYLIFLKVSNMQASDRFNINSQLEHLQAKYVGTGHADLNRFEWAVNIQRDSYASYVGHYPILSYFAIAENESIGRERYNFMQYPNRDPFQAVLPAYCWKSGESHQSTPRVSRKCCCPAVCHQNEKKIKKSLYWCRH